MGLPPIHNSSRVPGKSARKQQQQQQKADGGHLNKRTNGTEAGDGEQTLSMVAIGLMVLMRLLFSSCATGQRETFALAVKDRMNMSEGWIGAFLSYKGVVAMLANS